MASLGGPVSLGCGDDAAPSGKAVPVGAKPPSDEPTAQTAGHAYSARRCGECHGKTTETWATSAHARAARSPTYRAMRDASGRDDCDRCHAPLRALFPDEPILADEGVTCDACHTLRAVDLDPRHTRLEFDFASAVRYGPLCYAEDHYFHKMGCLPLYSQSDLCGGCHLWTTHTSAVPQIQVLSTYADWHAGPYAEAEQVCQGCHMSARSGEVAVGWGTRTSASDHGMFGPDQELRGQAIDLELRVVAAAETIEIDLQVSNEGAGHLIPAGLASRRIIAHVTVLGTQGPPLAHDQRVYGRILVDQSGAEVPFYAAHHVASDTRLAPHEARREHFSLPRAEAARVKVEVFDYVISDRVAEIIGVPPPEPTPLAALQITLEGEGPWEAEAR